MLNKLFIALVRSTAYYQLPVRNMQNFEGGFEAATKQADAYLEQLDD